MERHKDTDLQILSIVIDILRGGNSHHKKKLRELVIKYLAEQHMNFMAKEVKEKW